MIEGSLSNIVNSESVNIKHDTGLTKSKHIAFSIKRIGDLSGGAEKVLSEVANGLHGRGYRITIICRDRPGSSPYYPLHPDIDILYLDSRNANGFAKAFGFLYGVGALRRAYKSCRPDVAVSFMHSSYISAGLGLIGCKIPLIASEHTGPEQYKHYLFQNIFLQITPLLVKRITVVSEQIRSSFNPWIRRKMCVVHNPINIPPKLNKINHPELHNRTKVLLSVGRLTTEKNQACLIAAFASIANRFPDWTLRIAGEGPLRAKLEAQIVRSGLSGRAVLPGNITDIGREYEMADLFVLPSSYESFGLATAEAIMHGLPAIGFADCPGTNTLIRPGENGVLVFGVDKIEALAEALAALMGDLKALQSLQNAPTAWLQEAHSIDTVLDAWEQLFDECVDEKVCE